MSVQTLKAPTMPQEVSRGSVASRQLRYFRAQVEDWYDECRRVPVWEQEYLVDDPQPEALAHHARIIGELEQVGNWLAQAAQSPDFPDRATADLISMALRDLRDARSMWHGSATTEQQRREILKQCFNES